MLRALFVALIMSMVFTNNCYSLERKLSEANWREMALENLTKDGQPLTDQQLTSHPSLRCIKMNNYYCLMQTSESNPWKGSTGWDSANHAVFSDPVWSVRGIVRDACSKHRASLDTALEIAEKYSPWCDTLGTVGQKGEWGRSCSGGPQPPAGFSGPLCKKPASGVPAAGQCQSCNCPSQIAQTMVRGSGIAINDNLGLFTDAGQVNVEHMKVYISNLALQEIGLRPTDTVLEAGIAAAGICQPR